MNAQSRITNAGGRVHYCAWYLGLNDNTRYRGYAIRKLGESDLEAAIRSISRRLNTYAFEISTPSAMDDATYSFRIFSRLTKRVREDIGEGRLKLLL